MRCSPGFVISNAIRSKTFDLVWSATANESSPRGRGASHEGFKARSTPVRIRGKPDCLFAAMRPYCSGCFAASNIREAVMKHLPPSASRRRLAILAAAFGLAVLAAPAQAFTIDDQSNTNSNGSARYADPDARFSGYGTRPRSSRATPPCSSAASRARLTSATTPTGCSIQSAGTAEAAGFGLFQRRRLRGPLTGPLLFFYPQI